MVLPATKAWSYNSVDGAGMPDGRSFTLPISQNNIDHVAMHPGPRLIEPRQTLYAPTATASKQVRFLDRIGVNAFSEQF